MNTTRGRSIDEQHVHELIELAAAMQNLTDEQQAYEQLGQALSRVLPEGTIINISSYLNADGKYFSQVLLGLGPWIDKIIAMIGKRPKFPRFIFLRRSVGPHRFRARRWRVFRGPSRYPANLISRAVHSDQGER